MSILIPFVLICVATVALACRQTKTALITLTLVIAALWLVGSGVLTAALVDKIQMSDRAGETTWRSRNVIVLLGWEMERWPSGEVTTGLRGAARVSEAAHQYFGCRLKAKVCKIILSGGDPLARGRPEAEAMAQDLRQLNVASADLILEPRSNNTFKNAEYSTALIKDRNFDHIVLVTSGFHLRRSLLYFAHFTTQPIQGIPADHLDPEISAVPQTYNFTLFDLAVTEILGLWRYRVYNSLGWNPPRVAI